MNRAIIFGTGYIGLRLAQRLIGAKLFKEIILTDTVKPEDTLPRGSRFVIVDVRTRIDKQLKNVKSADWIFNTAAIHREPGHQPNEYYDTNIPGAKNVCEFAEKINCKNILFTSSIAVYGTLIKPADESSLLHPDTPYGVSKLCAELIHEVWQGRESAMRRLIVVRPGVIYGPGDPGNIKRMIDAIRGNRFVIPGAGNVRKSYGYIVGLLDSILFVMERGEPKSFVYNYVENNTETLQDLVDHVRRAFDIFLPVPQMPVLALAGAASIIKSISKNKDIDPLRVRKAARSTHIVPRRLAELGFEFRYPFAFALRDWIKSSPKDFEAKEG